MSWHLLALVGGLALLVGGAEALVRGSSAAALRLGVRPLVVGLTVVAFGTSSPELVVSLQAAFQGNGGIALGNVIGSNIANLALILGVTVVIRPVAAHLRLIRLDIPIVIGCSVLLTILLANGTLGRWEGLLLMTGIAAYVTFTLRQAKEEPAEADLLGETVPAPGLPLWSAGLLAVGGLALLVAGAQFMVGGAVALAARLGISQAVIGLTVVAIGTSLPELATSAVAAARGEGDLAVGNVVGSNIFNILGVLGLSALASPLSSPDIGWGSLAMMNGTALLLLPLMRSGFRLVRWEGALLLALYAGYLYLLVPA